MVRLGFVRSRNALCAANVVHLLMGVALMGAAVYGTSFGPLSRLKVISGAMATGFFLVLVSLAGIVGALRQHQLLLFLYILILLLVSVVQFSISCSCLGLRRGTQEDFLSECWTLMSDVNRLTLEQHLDCCGLWNSLQKHQEFRRDVNLCTAECKAAGHCFTCGDVMLQRAGDTLGFLGGVGLFCSISQLVTVWLAVRYRNMKES